jgi:hypothetical protein
MAGRAPRAVQIIGFKLRPVLHAMSLLDLQTARMRPGVRRAALPRQSPVLTPGQRRRLHDLKADSAAVARCLYCPEYC